MKLIIVFLALIVLAFAQPQISENFIAQSTVTG